jgi:hypothetical protein
MSTRKTNNDNKVATVCCSVRVRYKEAITEYVKRENKGSVANVMGKILEKWADDNKLIEKLLDKETFATFLDLEFREDN